MFDMSYYAAVALGLAVFQRSSLSTNYVYLFCSKWIAISISEIDALLITRLLPACVNGTNHKICSIYDSKAQLINFN